ncbi:ROK family protein [Streptomyces cocklensis]|jgi:glucokinase|uniref:2-epi-5-epi-valiolone 7-kinase n=1 Tax=Actinacidiphila cocklensis TaxID=887465 RepID=A0A9W4GRG4_9ACTN|nr:ROK family protein [Actinacidiphila cocklensis]MDD1060783.1 ROK family protein [Actinacidiphila cocklensis]CAG6394654.1 2-epi-5-epi-valiolone 7-kinase [Actinacidiphila cocklensis]
MAPSTAIVHLRHRLEVSAVGATVRPITVLDVGGTYLRWAAWSPEHGLGQVRSRPSPSRSRLPGAAVEDLQATLVDAMAEPVPPAGVAGVSFGAALDHRAGTVYASAPLWGASVRPFDLLGALRAARPDVRWHIVNDVTAALLHLADSPPARERRKILLATISTGIACRSIDQRTGDIPVDGCGLQGEIGHLPASVALDGVPVDLRCDCGHLGHVAAFSSGPGICRLAEVLRDREPERWNASPIGTRLASAETFEAALAAALDEGDPVATRLLDAAAGPVADVVRTALCLDPRIDLVAFTGGVATALGAHYRAAVLGHLERSGLYLTSQREPGWVRDRIMVCGPGQANGLVGAGLAAIAGEAA